MGGQGVVPPPLSWSLRAAKSLGLGSAASTGTGHPHLQGEELLETMRNLRSFRLRWVTAVLGDTSVLWHLPLTAGAVQTQPESEKLK